MLYSTVSKVYMAMEGLVSPFPALCLRNAHSWLQYRPVRLHGIELADDMDSKAPPTMPEPALADVIGSFDNIADPEFDIDPTVVTVDRNYEYSIWISYAEVYNERVYDLLASVKDESGVAEGTSQRATGAKGMLLTRQALPLRPSPPTDNPDSESHGKYIAGLRQFRVHSASQAKAIIKLGQLHRRVFGTLANRESSRSHGMVIIKVVRGHRGERNVSQLSDLCFLLQKKRDMENKWCSRFIGPDITPNFQVDPRRSRRL